MLQAPGSDYCHYHSRSLPPGDASAPDLLASIEDFSTSASVNRFLANVVRQFASNRIQRRDAIALAYMGQLLLNSVAAMNRENLLGEKEGPTQIIIDIPRPDRTEQLQAQKNKLAAANPDQPQPIEPHPPHASYGASHAPRESKPPETPPAEWKPPDPPASEPPKPPGICYGGSLRNPGAGPPSRSASRGRWSPSFHGPPG